MMIDSSKIFITLLLLIAIVLLYSTGLHQLSTLHLGNDFKNMYTTANYFHHHQSIYTPNTHPHAAPKAKLISISLNNPVFYLFFLPFAFLPYIASFISWTLLSLGGYLTSIFIIINHLKLATLTNNKLLLTLLALLFFPCFLNTMLGQVACIMTLPITLAWLAYKNQRYHLSAIIFGLLTAIKWPLGLLIFLFMAKKHFQACIFYIISFLIITGISIIIIGPDNYHAYFKVIEHITWYASNWNGSILGFFSRIFGTHGMKFNPIFHILWLTKAIWYLGSAALFFLLYKCRNINDDKYFSLLLICLLLITPLGWVYYYTWLLVPILILTNKALENSGNYPLFYTLLCFFIFSGNPAIQFNLHVIGWPQILLFYATSFYALIFLLLSLYLSTKKAIQPPLSKSLITACYSVALVPSFMADLYMNFHIHLVASAFN